MRRQWSWVDDLGQEDPSGCRNGEQDAEAVERHLLWTLPPSRRGRNGEQDAEAVERVLARRIRVAPASRNGEQDAEAVELFKRHARWPVCPRVGTENRMRRQWSSTLRTIHRSSRIGRNGEQDAEAVEPEGVAVPIERDHAGRNGEQDAEAVELVEVGQRIGGALQSERRTGCGGSGAIDPTSSTAGPKQSERRTGCGGSGAGSMTSGRRTRRVVGTENRMRRQWSDTYFGLCRQAAEVGTENRMRRQWSCSSGTLVGQCVRASERRTGCGGSGAARYGRSIGHPGLVGTENRMRRQWSLRA